jgi:hypothetical protein
MDSARYLHYAAPCSATTRSNKLHVLAGVRKGSAPLAGKGTHTPGGTPTRTTAKSVHRTRAGTHRARRRKNSGSMAGSVRNRSGFPGSQQPPVAAAGASGPTTPGAAAGPGADAAVVSAGLGSAWDLRHVAAGGTTWHSMTQHRQNVHTHTCVMLGAFRAQHTVTQYTPLASRSGPPQARESMGW